MYFSRTLNWRFTNLNHSFESLVGTKTRNIMVYCDLVEPTIVGAQWHPLLREVYIDRKGEGRSSVEPFHRQYLPMRRGEVDVIELQLAHPDGKLIVLPPGQTLVTIGIKQEE